jgi:class 3 adenylate cyclase
VRATTGFALEPRNRVIATLLFTDLVASTERARYLGDIAQHAAGLGLQVRAGVHVGEVQVLGSALRGVAVHEAARVMRTAAADEVLVSETTVNLASASNLRFVDRGVHELEGLAGDR